MLEGIVVAGIAAVAMIGWIIVQRLDLQRHDRRRARRDLRD